MDKNENRVVIKYFWLKGYKPIQIFEEMREVLGEEMAPSWTTVKNWVAEFKRGRLSIEDTKRTGRPKEVTTLENISKVEQMVEQNRHLKVADIAKAIGFSKERACNILVKELGMRKRENGWERITQSTEDEKVDEETEDCAVKHEDIKEDHLVSTTLKEDIKENGEKANIATDSDSASSAKKRRL